MPDHFYIEVSGVLRRMYDAGRAFTLRAGTIILMAMILVWALLYFPSTDANRESYPERIEKAETAAKENSAMATRLLPRIEDTPTIANSTGK